MDTDYLYQQLKRAYKKLKASVYFDKTQLVLRNRIVEYEGTSETYVDERLEHIANILSSKSSNKWNKYVNGILDSIKVLSFPKKINIANEDTLIINEHKTEVEVDEKQYFIDMNVEGQILGILWILLFGVDIDNDFYIHSYGNRLNKKLIDEKNGLASFSPYLFKPYYEQYESWRDIGLQCAQECLKKNQDVMIFTMDFKRFFYSVDFTETIFNDFCKEDQHEEVEFKRINDFVFKVLTKYSSLFDDYDNRVFLPIGFFPSNILSNWYLDKFDNEIIKRWNPLYYGRYVDDVIIVEKLEKNSPVLKIISDENNSTKKANIIEYYLCNCRNDLRKGCPKDFSLLVKKGNDFTINTQIFFEENCDYTINPVIELQNKKVKLFYFDNHGSDALITCFRNEISKNKSEFRFLPDDGAVFEDDDYSEIYDVKYSDTLNKLRGVDGTSIDKYALSKFLGKYLRIGNLITDKKESKFVKDIIRIFDHKATIENYLAWEKVLLYLVINEKIDAFVTFVQIINKAICNIVDKHESLNDNIRSISESLKIVLFSAVVRSLSHIWGPSIQKGIERISGIFMELPEIKDSWFDIYETFTLYRNNYCKSRMCDKYLIPVLIDAILDDFDSNFNDEEVLNLTQLSVCMSIAHNLILNKITYQYYPYMISPQDISMCITLHRIKRERDLLNSQMVIEQISKIHMRLNYLCDPNEEWSLFKNIQYKLFDDSNDDAVSSFAIKVGDWGKKKLKIAIANVSLKEKDFIGALTDSPNRKFERYNKLSKVVNAAIKNDADILVLPENYVPFEWVSTLARISTKTKMAIITGIEHIKSNKTVYNLTATILPYVNKDYAFSYVSFHTKVFYSPEEERQISGYGLGIKEGKTFDLFVWNDLWFSTYCCYELASIKNRCLFLSYIDLLAVVEWNRDINYYSNIIESLSRDMHCYCVQVNSSNYGDSRITQPAKTESKDIIKTKGGLNETILIGEIDINSLRDFQFKKYELQKDDKHFKPTPPNYNRDIVEKRIKGTLFDNIN